MLSPPYEASFTIPGDGEFSSVGGYWNWLVLEKSCWKQVSGEAVLFERESLDVHISNSFRRKILQATWYKINQNRTIFWRMERNVKEFLRYIVTSDGIFVPSDAEWLCDGLDVIDEHIRKNHW